MTALLLRGGHDSRSAVLRGLTCSATVWICLLLAGLVLGAARSLYRAGLVGPLTLRRALTCSAGLTHVGLHAWRDAARIAGRGHSTRAARTRVEGRSQ